MAGRPRLGPRPYGARVTVRLDPYDHDRLVERARREGVPVVDVVRAALAPLIAESPPSAA